MSQEEREKTQEGLPKKYSVLQNMHYVMQGTFQVQKPLIFFMPATILMSVIGSYLPTFALSAIIDQITQKCTVPGLIMTILLFFGVLLVVQAVQTFADAHIWWRLIYARMQFMVRQAHKALFMDYEYLESAKIMDACYKAQDATAGNRRGVEGMMRSFQSMMTTLVSALTAAIIVWQLSPWMVLLLIGLGVLDYYNMDWAKKHDKKIWDEKVPYWRKTGYMKQIMTDFTYGKDIRLFSMKSWLIGKYKDLNNLLYSKIVKTKNLWLRCAAINQLLFLVEEGSIYAYLIYRMLNSNMSIAEFTLYLGAVWTFFGVLQTIFNDVTVNAP